MEARLHYKRDGAAKRSGDAKLVLMVDSSEGVKEFRNGHHYVEYATEDGRILRQPLGNNVYVPDGDDVREATVHLPSGTVTLVTSAPATTSGGGAAGADAGIASLQAALIAAGDHLALRDLFVEVHGWDGKRALAVAKAACKGAAAE